MCGTDCKRTPCIILYTSWIPGERVYDVGVFRVLDIYKYTPRLLKAAHCYFSTSTIPGFYIHPHSHKKGRKLRFISAVMATVPAKLLLDWIQLVGCISPQDAASPSSFPAVQDTSFHSLPDLQPSQLPRCWLLFVPSPALCNLTWASFFSQPMILVSFLWLRLFSFIFLRIPTLQSSTQCCPCPALAICAPLEVRTQPWNSSQSPLLTPLSSPQGFPTGTAQQLIQALESWQLGPHLDFDSSLLGLLYTSWGFSSSSTKWGD